MLLDMLWRNWNGASSVVVFSGSQLSAKTGQVMIKGAVAGQGKMEAAEGTTVVAIAGQGMM